MLRFFVLLVLLLPSPISASEHWPGWRGPSGMGSCDDKDLPLKWDAKSGENVLWKAPLLPPGKVRADQNQSSPVIWGGRVFVTLSYWPEGASEKDYPEHHVLCFDGAGMKVWDTVVPPGPWKLTDLRGGYTAPTPACDAERVYVLFGSAVVAALDHKGKILWREEITPHFFDVAIGTSPVLHRDTLFVVCDQLREEKSSSLRAYDAKNGKLRWEQKRSGVDWAHSTPILADIKGKTQLLLATANGPQGLDPATGDVLWSFTMPSRVGDTVSPTYRDGLLYMDSGRGGPGIAVDATGAGAVSKTHQKWSIKNVPEGFSSPLLVGDYLYRLHSPSVLTCLKWDSGEVVFKERLEGVNPAASPVASADGRLYLASSGKSYVLKAGPKLDVLAVNDLDDASQASPAVAAGKIYLKGRRYLYCIEKK